MSKKAKKKNYHHGNLFDAILAASTKLIVKKGVAGFSLREAASHIGVDPSACYRHFKNKNSILHALAQKGFMKLALMIDIELKDYSSATVEKKIEILGFTYFTFASTQTAFFRIMFGPLGVDSRDSSLAGHYPNNEGPYDTLLRLVNLWIKQNNLNTQSETVSLELWSSIHGLTCLVLDGALQTELKFTNMQQLIKNHISSILKGHKN
ncbi:MAG: TetR/AcrR family transcriptional regulator [Pseudobdellovibrio sp.]